MPNEDDNGSKAADSGASSPDLGPETQGYGGFIWPIRRSTRPSLDTLQYDQRSLVYSGDFDRIPPLEPIVDGFHNRRQLINWYQAATVRTFGHITEYWPTADLARDRALVDALTDRPHTDDRPRDQAHVFYHTRLVEAIVLPACGKAYRHLRDKSAERTSTSKYADDQEDWDEIDPEAETHISMRPAYSRLDVEQASVLAELWEGFDSRGELGEWLHSLHPATYGTYGGPEAADMLADQFGREAFLEDTPHGRLVRERYAIVELLPAFADAARRLRAAEMSETESDNTWRAG